MRSAMACMLSKNRQPTLFRHHYQRKTCTKPLSNIRIVSPLRVRVQARGHNNFTLRKPGLHHTRYTFPKTCHDGLQGYLAHKKHPSPRDRHRSLGIGLLTGPTGGVFLMSKVPLKIICPIRGPPISRALHQRGAVSDYVGSTENLQGLLEIKDTHRPRVIR